MKKFLFLLLLITWFSRAQEGDPSPYQFTEVINVKSSLSAKQLQANAKIWFTETYKDPREVILLDDPDNHILLGRGVMRYSSKIFVGGTGRQGWIMYDIKIMCKDGKYKYDFTNFVHTGKGYNLGLITNEKYLSTFTGSAAGGEKYKTKVTNELREFIKNDIEPLIERLKRYMDKALPTQEDW